MSEIPDGIEPAPIPEPKDSSLGILLRRRGEGAFDVLLGRRARTSRFMPGHLAFPGGRMEAGDHPERPGAFERCVAREFAEETALTIPPEAWRAAGERTTPPFFPLRFRTKFFVAELPAGAALPKAPPRSDELETLAFADPAVVLADWAGGVTLVPPPILPILRMMTAEAPADAAAVARAVSSINAAEEPQPRIEFTPGIWALPLRTRTLPPASCTNVWMPGAGRFVVVDPGSTDPEDGAWLLRVIRRREALGASVEAVVLTHHHRDHVDGASQLARTLGVPIAAHANTFELLPEPGPGMATRVVSDGDRIELDGMTLDVLHTPGHAPGHIALFERSRRVLIAGDLVSGLSTILIGFRDGDMGVYLASLRRAAALDPALVLPSHGPPLPGSALTKAIAHREDRERRVLEALRPAARLLAEIAREAYADTPQAPAFLAQMQTRAHLIDLARRGAAAAASEDLTRWSR
jgi:glyoxylase-like metal-dependent hydrolase (beta-lactamase superfamily II)/8-oxo-dGTP pyrophosphatase MutT (NUDIX family)